MNQTFSHIHFIGIKGVGMSALALVAKGMGYAVTGSDTAEIFITDQSLHEAGITPLVGFAADHIGSNVDLVVVGAAYGTDNPEVAAATARQLPVWTYSQLLGYLAKHQKTIAVAGTHGKTTTTSILAFLLEKAGLQPSWVIGTGHVAGLSAHGAAGNGQYFVTEADDYKRSPNDNTPKFLDLEPTVALITSIEHDHPDMYPTLEDCVAAFVCLAQKVKDEGFLVVNGDDPNVTRVRRDLPDKQFVSYGFGSVDYRIVAVDDGFSLVTTQETFGPFTSRLIGEHNLMNAAAAIVTALRLGVSVEAIQRILPEFHSVERRFELVGKVGEQVIIDDYAHHPTAVRLTLEAAKKQYPGQPIWCLFQSHTYSRTQALLNEFATAFAAADAVVVTDIFGSAREQQATITTEALTSAIAAQHPQVRQIAKNELLTFIETIIPKNAVIITMGAGDIYKIGHQYVEKQRS